MRNRSSSKKMSPEEMVREHKKLREMERTEAAEGFGEMCDAAKVIAEKVFGTITPDVVLEIMSRLPAPPDEDDPLKAWSMEDRLVAFAEDLAFAAEQTEKHFGDVYMAAMPPATRAQLVLNVYDFIFPEEDVEDEE